MTKDNTRTMLKNLIEVFGEDFSDELKKYVLKNTDYYLNEDKMNNLRYIIRDTLYDAENDLDYQEQHKDDKVTLNRRTKMMYFNKMPLPAYWYKPGMSKKEVDAHLEEYRDLWEDLEFGEIQYPMMETWHSLNEWNHEYSLDEIREMEETLEKNDTDSAHLLTELRMYRTPVYNLRHRYPIKIKEIIKTDNYRIDDDELCADMDLLLFNNEICPIIARYSIKGHSHGMTARGKKGFPSMTDDDEKLVEETFFRTILGKKVYEKNKDSHMILLNEAVKKV